MTIITTVMKMQTILIAQINFMLDQVGEEKWFMNFFIEIVSVLPNEELVLHLLVYHQITSMEGKTEWNNKQTLFLMKRNTLDTSSIKTRS